MAQNVKISASKKTRRLVQLAILTAVIFIMAFTPLGYLKAGPVSISFLTIPVTIGAILGGWQYGLVLGTMFGLTSFIQCFGLDPFGAMLLGINPVLTFIMCVIPRALMGTLTAVIFKALSKIDKTKLLSFGAASVSGALLNTIFFVGALVLFFGSNTSVQSALGASNVIGVITVIVTVNAAIEAVVCLIAGTAITKTLAHIVPSVD